MLLQAKRFDVNINILYHYAACICYVSVFRKPIVFPGKFRGSSSNQAVSLTFHTLSVRCSLIITSFDATYNTVCMYYVSCVRVCMRSRLWLCSFLSYERIFGVPTLAALNLSLFKSNSYTVKNIC